MAVFTFYVFGRSEGWSVHVTSDHKVRLVDLRGRRLREQTFPDAKIARSHAAVWLFRAKHDARKPQGLNDGWATHDGKPAKSLTPAKLLAKQEREYRRNEDEISRNSSVVRPSPYFAGYASDLLAG